MCYKPILIIVLELGWKIYIHNFIRIQKWERKGKTLTEKWRDLQRKDSHKHTETCLKYIKRSQMSFSIRRYQMYTYSLYLLSCFFHKRKYYFTNIYHFLIIWNSFANFHDHLYVKTIDQPLTNESNIHKLTIYKPLNTPFQIRLNSHLICLLQLSMKHLKRSFINNSVCGNCHSGNKKWHSKEQIKMVWTCDTDGRREDT